MDAKLQRRVQRYGWDRAEAKYEAYWARQLQPAQEKLLAMADLSPGERVLEMACGTGLVTLPVARAVGAGGFVLATDLSGQMVERAAAEARRAGLAWVRCERMEAESIVWDGEPFDAAVCALGLMYVPDPVAALGEMRRLLRPGGRAVSAVWGQRDRCGWAEIFPIVDARVQSEVCPLFFQLGTGEAQKRAFERAGFASVASERLSTTLLYETPEMALGAAFAGGPVALAYAHFDEPTRESAHEEYLASIEPHRRGEGYAVPGEFVVTRGVVG